MIHYGDITKISGYDVPVVDCIIGGSPCQDLSVAGKRAGLDGERSGLFMEQIRITKEMRDNDSKSGRSNELLRPRFFVWENVPGAFSSNKGEDFRVVLEEIAKVVEKDAVIPMPPKNKWTTSGCIMGDGWSIAWRILDAQFWGVPQRRRRIALVADFGGGCAQEVLFVREGLSRHSEESRTERKGATTDAEGCFGVHDRDGKTYGFPLGFRPENVRCYEETATTLCVGTRAGFCNGVISINHQGGNVEQIIEDKTGTLTASMNSSGNNKLSVAYCYDARGNGDGEVCCTLTGDHQNRITDYSAVVCEPVKCYDIGDRRSVANESVDVSPTLLSKMGTGGNNVPVIVEGLDCYNQQMTGDKTMTLTNCATDPHHIPCVVKSVGCDMYNLAETGDVAASLTTATGQGASNTGPSVIVMDRSAYNQGTKSVCYIDTSHADDVVRTDDVVAPLQARDYKGGKLIAMTEGEPVICLQGNGIDRADTAGCNGKGWKEGTSYTLNTVDRPAICYKKPHYIVRRLTPLECERLQGFADGWTDIGEYTDSKGKKKKTSDSARYKALGNSIALPPWKWVLKRICSHYERDATMASLFDGIGGFPCIWEQINGKGTAVWASEIEDFPIAVTKARIE